MTFSFAVSVVSTFLEDTGLMHKHYFVNGVTRICFMQREKFLRITFSESCDFNVGLHAGIDALQSSM